MTVGGGSEVWARALTAIDDLHHVEQKVVVAAK